MLVMFPVKNTCQLNFLKTNTFGVCSRSIRGTLLMTISGVSGSPGFLIKTMTINGVSGSHGFLIKILSNIF